MLACLVLAVAWTYGEETPGAGAQGDDFSRMLLDRPGAAVIKPKGYRKPKSTSQLPAPGSAVIDRRCWLTRDARSGWFLARFEAAPGSLPLRRLLPCRLLEKMEALVEKDPATVFRITGETTVCKGRGYLLPRKLTIESPLAEMPETVPAELATVAPSQPGQAEGTASPDEIIKRLMGDRPGRPVTLADVPISDSLEVEEPVAGGAAKRLLTAHRGVVVDRVVYALPEKSGKWWHIRFESDNTLQEPPLRLLPCKLLEKVEGLVASGEGNTVKLRVTGEVTIYKGMRYLLLRKVLRERQMGQF